MKGLRIGILATDGFERAELVELRDRFIEAGAEVEVISPHGGTIRAWQSSEWDDEVPVDRTIAEARVDAYDLLAVPGGRINPDKLRTDSRAVAFVRDFARTGKPLGAICHGPWLLVEADLVRGRRVTSYPSIRTDLRNAGGLWVDAPVAVDGSLVTSRRPADLAKFFEALAEKLVEAPPPPARPGFTGGVTIPMP